jgi:hypothetical protein
MRLMSILFFAGLILKSLPTLCQQTVAIDWDSKKITSQPATINSDSNVAIDVSNVNDVLFTYSISTESTPIAIDDFSQIANAFGLSNTAAKGKGEAPSCNYQDFLNSVKALVDAENVFLELPASSKGCSAAKPCSMTLGDAKTAWDKVLPLLATAKSKEADSKLFCTAQEYDSAYASSQAALDQADSITASFQNGTHVAQSHALVKPDYTTSIEIDEFWNGKPTNKSVSVTLSNTNTRLTLSAGALFSELQNRSYSITAAPSTSASSTKNVLAVSGESKFSPLAIGLLNYEVPRLSNDEIGLAISTGPVLRLGTSSGSSSFGYFGGVSVHLYHRFYVSPGLNLGQFADNPPGLSAGSAVPSGITTPSPVNRWTWRFSFALTYKTKDFSKLGLSASTISTSNTGGAATNNKAQKVQPSAAATQPPAN